jgi:hypothetical protein
MPMTNAVFSGDSMHAVLSAPINAIINEITFTITRIILPPNIKNERAHTMWYKPPQVRSEYAHLDCLGCHVCQISCGFNRLSDSNS